MHAPAHTGDAEYLAFLRGRWAVRAHRLAAAAFFGSLVIFAFDLACARCAGGPAPGAIAAARLPWIALPVCGWGMVRAAPQARWLPAAIVALALTWAWGNDWAYLHLGLAGAVQAIAIVSFFITSATFLPIAMRGRIALFAVMAAGHLALDLLWPDARPLRARACVDAAIVALAACEVFVFENFNVSQRRGFRLRRELEDSVAAIARLAAGVAHDVNNPLSAVKVNVGWLGDSGPGAPADERAQVVRETLEAVDRIARIVTELKARAAEHEAGRAARGSRPRV